MVSHSEINKSLCTLSVSIHEGLPASAEIIVECSAYEDLSLLLIGCIVLIRDLREDCRKLFFSVILNACNVLFSDRSDCFRFDLCGCLLRTACGDSSVPPFLDRAVFLIRTAFPLCVEHFERADQILSGIGGINNCIDIAARCCGSNI